MRLAYADPPYPGMSAKHYSEHPDYAGEVDHWQLTLDLQAYDGFVLHTSSPSLLLVLDALKGAALIAQKEQDWRVMAWVKPFAAFKANVPVAYAWEPVIVKAARKPEVSDRLTLRDWVSEPMTMQRGLTGAKPDAVCRWAFEVMGADRDDTLEDLYPGSGAVSRAWESWRNQMSIFDALDGRQPG